MLVLEMNDCLHLVLVRLCRSECLGLVLRLAQDEHPNIVQKTYSNSVDLFFSIVTVQLCCCKHFILTELEDYGFEFQKKLLWIEDISIVVVVTCVCVCVEVPHCCAIPICGGGGFSIFGLQLPFRLVPVFMFSVKGLCCVTYLLLR